MSTLQTMRTSISAARTAVPAASAAMASARLGWVRIVRPVPMTAEVTWTARISSVVAPLWAAVMPVALPGMPRARCHAPALPIPPTGANYLFLPLDLFA